MVEAVQITKYLRTLICDHNFQGSDIGVISPYRKQVCQVLKKRSNIISSRISQTEKIRLLISRLGLEDVKVGSVEEFQGQERKIILMTAVRSNELLINWDLRFNLGFLSCPKRFNVAITRSQVLLVIVGNPFVLANVCFGLTL